ncbi:MAG TPA: serine/threonine-protein kinase [Kofleriaceae bacterium]|nr:serine/threonine-protein kinase [Kofleriaceae bacterium]
MKCPRCGNSIEAGARFCGVCGDRLEDSGVATAPAANRPASRPASRPAADKAAAPARAPQPSRGGTSREKPRAAQAAGKHSEIALVPVQPASDPYIGTTLNGRFTIEKKLGEGGFGAVYNGVQLLTGRRVAIKLLHPEMTRDQNVVARFRREGQVLCSLRDAHTITTYDFDQTTDGTLFIAMELLEGRSLHDVFHDEAPIKWQRMLKIISEMCSSLEEAHSLGIVHRDLKPENIYLENRPGNPEFVKILDFGIAKVMRGDGSSGIAGDMSPQLTATGQTLGTLEYMSPEQLMGKPLDGRSDIYGLGVVAFEMVTGRLPFPDAVGPAALISAQLKKVPPSPSQIYPKGGMPPMVDELILRMLAKDKNQRFRDMSELRREIDGILSSERDASARHTAPSTPPARSATPPPSDRQQPRSAAPARPASSAGPVMGGPVGHVGHAQSSPPSPITARGPGPRPPVPTRGPSPVPNSSGFTHDPGEGDPPWAGARPAGSSVSPGRSPRASGRPSNSTEREPPRQVTGASTTPWMWITVAAILFLAIVIGGVLAMR